MQLGGTVDSQTVLVIQATLWSQVLLFNAGMETLIIVSIYNYRFRLSLAYVFLRSNKCNECERRGSVVLTKFDHGANEGQRTELHRGGEHTSAAVVAGSFCKQSHALRCMDVRDRASLRVSLCCAATTAIQTKKSVQLTTLENVDQATVRTNGS